MAGQSAPQFGSVFISYSHKDQEWLDKIKTYLKPIENAGALSIWDDLHINPGSNWYEEIQKALKAARVGLLLVSPDFLASDFIMKEELPVLIAGTTLIWVPLRACLYQFTSLKDIQAAHPPTHPLNGLTQAQQDAALVSICNSVIAAAQKAAPSAQNPAPAAVSAPITTPLVAATASFVEIKKTTLQRRLAQLQEEWTAINEQFDANLNEGDRLRLQLQAQGREAEIRKVEAEIAQLL